MPTILAIDTALEACSVSVSNGDDDIQTLYEPMGRGQTERLLPMIVETCGQAGIALKDVEAVAVTRGPGSFTGVRVGLSVARTLSTIQDIPLYGFTTFDAVALLSPHNHYVIALNSKRNDVYAQEINNNGASLPPYLSTITDIRQKSGDIPVIGNVVGFEQLDLSKLTQAMIKNHKNGINDRSPVYLREADISESKKTYATLSDNVLNKLQNN